MYWLTLYLLCIGIYMEHIFILLFLCIYTDFFTVAIFSRPAVYIPSPERWQLQVVPCILKISATFGALFTRGQVDTNMADIYEKLTEKANVGGRLICLECTGNRERGQESWACAGM